MRRWRLELLARGVGPMRDTLDDGTPGRGRFQGNPPPAGAIRGDLPSGVGHWEAEIILPRTPIAHDFTDSALRGRP